jgi:hypothetical protein
VTTKRTTTDQSGLNRIVVLALGLVSIVYVSGLVGLLVQSPRDKAQT